MALGLKCFASTNSIVFGWLKFSFEQATFRALTVELAGAFPRETKPQSSGVAGLPDSWFHRPGKFKWGGSPNVLGDSHTMAFNTKSWSNDLNDDRSTVPP